MNKILAALFVAAAIALCIGTAVHQNWPAIASFCLAHFGPFPWKWALGSVVAAGLGFALLSAEGCVAAIFGAALCLTAIGLGITTLCYWIIL